uniref:Uncharacterized protein n=1 Tax=Ditylenchus dipsaci TaxID=166011 RepID=A0A915DXZ2_9BILA
MRSARGSPDRFTQLLDPLLQGYLNYIKICEARIRALNRGTSSEAGSSVWSDDSEDDQEADHHSEELSLLMENLRLYKFHASTLISLQAKYQNCRLI